MNLTEHKPRYSGPDQQKVVAADTRSRGAITRFRDAITKEFKDFWSQTPEEISAQLEIRGNRAAAAFALHAQGVALVLAADIPFDAADYTPPLAYTVHQDGTVTLD